MGAAPPRVTHGSRYSKAKVERCFGAIEGTKSEVQPKKHQTETVWFLACNGAFDGPKAQSDARQYILTFYCTYAIMIIVEAIVSIETQGVNNAFH